MPQFHAIVHGRVQGVSFRYYTVQKAQQLALTGWVRNRSDGTVETVAVGLRPVLETFLAWLHHGPSGAQVSQVEVDWSETAEVFTAFEVRYGAN